MTEGLVDVDCVTMLNPKETDLLFVGERPTFILANFLCNQFGEKQTISNIYDKLPTVCGFNFGQNNASTNNLFHISCCYFCRIGFFPLYVSSSSFSLLLFSLMAKESIYIKKKIRVTKVSISRA